MSETNLLLRKVELIQRQNKIKYYKYLNQIRKSLNVTVLRFKKKLAPKREISCLQISYQLKYYTLNNNTKNNNIEYLNGALL